ncbi:MAG: HPF/RaiA family ribosome-associated protein [Lentisphaeria bacterium]
MELIISVKHYDLSETDRKLAHDLADKLAEDYGKLNTLRMVMSTERNWYIVDALLNGKNVSLNAKARSTSMGASISNAIEKLDKQMRRYLEKVQDLSIKPAPQMKAKIWTSDELKKDVDDADLEDMED